MRRFFLLYVLFSFVSADDFTKMFDPDSKYLDKGVINISFVADKATDMGEVYNNYSLVNRRTIAVDPTKILPGSIVFIPDLAGLKLPDGTYHDGYFLAHRLLKEYPSANYKIYFKTRPEINSKKPFKIFEVQGAMAKSTRVHFELQFQSKEILPTYKMVASDFETLMKNSRKVHTSVADRIQYLAGRGKGTPYLVYNLGEGATSKIDPDPTIDFARTDCMTFCEHTLALAISSDYSEMYNNLQKIRYKDGRIGYLTRNHYTIADWLPNNSWLLEDVTKQIGANLTKRLSKTIDRPSFYKNNGVKDEDLAGSPGIKKVTVDYIPKEHILDISEKLRGGEIVSIVTTHPTVFSAHMGIIVKDKWGNVILRHASSTRINNEVIDERLSDYLDKMEKSSSRIGMIFIRVKEDYKIPQ